MWKVRVEDIQDLCIVKHHCQLTLCVFAQLREKAKARSIDKRKKESTVFRGTRQRVCVHYRCTVLSIHYGERCCVKVVIRYLLCTTSGLTVNPAHGHRLEDGQEQQTGPTAGVVVIDLEHEETTLPKEIERALHHRCITTSQIYTIEKLEGDNLIGRRHLDNVLIVTQCLAVSGYVNQSDISSNRQTANQSCRQASRLTDSQLASHPTSQPVSHPASNVASHVDSSPS